jgi:hypothetical protein
MTQLLLLFNHHLTLQQEEDAHKSLHVEQIVSPPQDVLRLWGQIPPELPQLSDYLKPVLRWLKDVAQPEDFILIQGDFGACFYMVQAAFGLNLIPICATTRREADEKTMPDGSIQVIHQFKHVLYRRYEKYP